MSTHRPVIKTEGWQLIYDLKDQCGICSHVVTEHRMACCDYGKKDFPAAHNCPIFKFDEEAE
jgi:hypothetical protein